MAGLSAVIGALRVVLGIDSASFTDGLSKAEDRAEKFGRAIGTSLKVASVAVAGAATAIGVAVQNALGEADEIGKAAQSIGIPVEELSRLKYAADLSDVSLESLSTSVGRLSRNMATAAKGGTKGIAAAFGQLGISVKNADGTLKSSSQVLAEIADKFAAMPNGARKTALAMELMGRSGATMIPLLNAGAAGLKEMTDEADRFGLTIDSKTAAAAETFNDNLTRLGAVQDGIVLKLTAHLAPALAAFSQRLIDAANNGKFVENVSNLLIGVFDLLGRAVTFVQQNFDTLLDVLKIFVGIKLVGYLAAGAGAFITFAKSVRAAGLTLKLFSLLTGGPVVKGLLLVGAVLAASTGQFEKFEQWLGGVWERVKTMVPALGDLETGLGALFGGDIESVDAAGAKSLASYFRTAEDAANSFGTVTDRVKSAAKSMASGIGSSFRSVGDSLEDVGRAVGNSLSGIFDSVIDGSFNAREALGNLLVDLGKMAMSSAFQALIGGFFGGGGSKLGFVGAGGIPIPGVNPFIGRNARGTDFWRGGPTWVGEEGPEILNLPRGSRITPNDEIGGGGTYVDRRVFNVDARGAQMGVADQITDALRAYDKGLPDRIEEIKASPRRR